jgi:hypothetical protein
MGTIGELALALRPGGRFGLGSDREAHEFPHVGQCARGNAVTSVEKVVCGGSRERKRRFGSFELGYRVTKWCVSDDIHEASSWL